MSNRRFELESIEERDGTVHIHLTVFTKIPGTEIRVGGNIQWTNSMSSSFWQFKDGNLLGRNDKLELAVFTERDDESDFVRVALKSHGYLPLETK